jgi:hypothetical protein
VANKTNNYKFPKPEVDDFYDISEYNKAMDILDDSLTEMDQKKLDKNGDASETITEFEQEILRENIESGETLSSTFGKVRKWFAEMKDVAFSGHAKDVTTDAAHRFVSDTEKSSWNGKVAASGGGVSETVIDNLESISTKYPVPAVGETAKMFMGKVKKYIEDTKPLDSDMFVYVAKTGNDDTGDGTSSKPFKTIQRAINLLPKDLGGNFATINVAAGTYDDYISIRGFHNGSLYILSDTRGTLSDTCKIGSMSSRYNSSYIYINGLTFTNANANVSVEVWDNNYFHLSYCQSTFGVLDKLGIYIGESKAVITNCRFANKSAVVQATNSSVSSANWDTGSINNGIGLQSVGGSIITKYGPQPVSNTAQGSYDGGLIFHGNGTQISNMITTGLNCTWGSLSGGFVRHGNTNGVAVIIVQMGIITSTNLTAGSSYSIGGFPTPATGNVVVSFGPQRVTNNCYLEGNTIIFVPLVNINSGAGFLFNATYLTNQ